MNKYLRSGLNAVGITVGIIFFALFFNLIILNLILGCETWDQSLWTDNNSCILPLEMIGVR